METARASQGASPGQRVAACLGPAVWPGHLGAPQDSPEAQPCQSSREVEVLLACPQPPFHRCRSLTALWQPHVRLCCDGFLHQHQAGVISGGLPEPRPQVPVISQGCASGNQEGGRQHVPLVAPDAAPFCGPLGAHLPAQRLSRLRHRSRLQPRLPGKESLNCGPLAVRAEGRQSSPLSDWGLAY